MLGTKDEKSKKRLVPWVSVQGSLDSASGPLKGAHWVEGGSLFPLQWKGRSSAVGDSGRFKDCGERG